MSNYWLKRTSASIQSLAPYQPGKPIQEVERELGITAAIKLASNENPLGPSPLAVEALKKCASLTARYPEGSAHELKQSLSEHLNYPSEYITVGNGSDELFRLLTQCFAGNDREVMYCQYGFSAYSICAQAFQTTQRVLPCPDWQVDINSLLAAVNNDTALIFLANPNNPTSTWINEQQLRQLLQGIPKSTILVLDEAYYEYIDDANYPDALPLLCQYDNLVITRTFSKIYGLAGLRLGYAVANPEIGEILNRVRLPFNTSLPAQSAGIAALADNEHLEASIAANTAGRQQLYQGFAELGVSFVAGQGNFVTIDCLKPSAPVYQALLARGVIVRPLANYELPNHLRVSIGLPEENHRLLEVWEQCYE